MTPRQELVSQARADLGLSGIPPSAWTYDQRIAYNRYLANLITKNAERFDAQSLAVANTILGEQNTPLDDTSVSANVGAFGSAFLDEVVEAGDAVGGIGRGVLNAAKLAAWVIPGGLLVLAGIYLWGKYKAVK